MRGRMIGGPVAFSLLLVVSSHASASARRLTFEDRVRAQEAIDRVYHSGQVGDARPFEQAVPRQALETKVRTSLEKSAALEELWETPVTPEMLRREVSRMVEQTQRAGRLRDLFAALGNDPFLIQECLARPVLVDRLTRNFFSFDQSIHAASRRKAEELRQAGLEGRIDPRVPHPDRTVEKAPRTEPGAFGPEAFEARRDRTPASMEEIRPVEEEREAFLVRLPFTDQDEVRTAVYSVRKEDWDGWWSRTRKRLDAGSIAVFAAEDDPAVAAAIASEKLQAASGCVDDTWDGGLLDEIPDRNAPSAWASDLMVIWAGTAAKGWRYDPVTDAWSLMSSVNAPATRAGHTVVSTGSQVMVWGGVDRSTGQERNDGGRYDPLLDLWTPLSTLNAPLARRGHAAVWTGSVMLVWGGLSSGFARWDGGRYDLATHTWSPMSTTNAPAFRQDFRAVWAGGRMIVWGGNGSGLAQDTGGVYDPVANTWTATSMSGAPSARMDFVAVSTGDAMIVWGGQGSSQHPEGRWRATGGRYDPATDTWSPTSTVDAPAARASHAGVWTGSEMMIWGGCGPGADGCPSNDGGRYDPQTDTWTTVSTLNAPSPRTSPSLLWTGGQVLVWGGFGGTISGGRYQPGTDSWTPISSGSSPAARSLHSAVWTGSHMVIWGGSTGSAPLMTGGRYDPALATWSPTATAGAPSPRSQHSAVWTGLRMIVWGGTNGAGYLGTGGRYDPLTDSWTPTSMTSAPSARFTHTAVWTGGRMVVWGGKSLGTLTNTGGRYDPDADTWSDTTTDGAPPFGYQHTAVWTGRLMLIWGGSDEQVANNTGARYDPVDDSWSAITKTGAPGARAGHGAAWTGQRMFIWGGSNNGSISTGGLYDPETNSWTPTVSPSASGRSMHTTVWTGSRIVVWGGFGNSSSDTGARYDPANASWSTTSVQDAPVGRTDHTAVWTGDRMLVWGGSGPLNTGSRYCACSGGGVATYYQDADGDGYGDPGMPLPACNPPSGYAANGADCDDTDAAISPGGAETCNGVDDNCSGTVDEGQTADNDGDGFACAGDCDDFDSAVHPGAAEICDQKDSDCDGFLPPADRDDDRDGFAVCQGDCRDDLAGFHPGAAEGCDGADTDCDGNVPSVEIDADGDGHRTCAGDCDDGNPARHPGAAEVCNQIDEDCDGIVDEGMPDSDGDGRKDCSDCRPSDPFTWAPPPVVTNLQVIFDQEDDVCIWDDLAPAAGPTVAYDVFIGSLAALRPSAGFSTGWCAASDTSFYVFDLSTVDAGPPGDGLYVLVRGRNSCGIASYGSPHRDQTAAASPSACP